MQKKLTTQPMWIGTVVHEIAEGALKAMQQGVTPWVERAVEMARERAEADIEASRAGRYEQDPKRYPGFQCHYYGQEEPDFDAAIEQIEAQLRTLFAHPVFRRMMAVPERIVEVEELRQIDIEGVPVWVVLDAMVSDGEGGLVIIDWKTGKDHEDEKIARQLGIYGIYATQERGVPVEQVRTLHVNTRFNTMTQHPVDAAVLDETRAFVRESADAMRAALTKPAENEGRGRTSPCSPRGIRPASGADSGETVGASDSFFASWVNASEGGPVAGTLRETFIPLTRREDPVSARLLLVAAALATGCTTVQDPFTETYDASNLYLVQATLDQGAFSYQGVASTDITVEGRSWGQGRNEDLARERREGNSWTFGVTGQTLSLVTSSLSGSARRGPRPLRPRRDGPGHHQRRRPRGPLRRRGLPHHHRRAHRRRARGGRRGPLRHRGRHRPRGLALRGAA
ncbi:MAG: PD-(D/E)XK nuclease family protein [Alphaproteobacteria bacterium]|nr:PD-(D/E)XK nuclease family protein [Alphaproteobacteria bacterium]